MVEESVFRGVIELFNKIGVYDIILPFLLIFTIVFAVLEKTKILGVEKSGDKQLTKKNLNSVVSFIVAFLVIASTQLVAVINEVMANIVLLLILAVSFLMLVGVFFGDKEFTLENYPKWTTFFMVLMFIGIVTIFLNALGWLEFLFGMILTLFVNWEAEWAATIIFLVIVIGFIAYITWDPKKKPESDKKE